MKRGLIIFLVVVVVLCLAVVLFLGYMGYLPTVGKIFGWDKPKDLGISFTEADYQSARAKSGVEYQELAAGTAEDAGIQFVGQHSVDTSWSSEEMTALLNDRPWKYWPISQVQLRINTDNSVEMTGVFHTEKLRGYGAGIGVPKAVLDRLSLLPSQAPFYLKGTASLKQNNVSTFDISQAQMGRVTIPANLLMSYLPREVVSRAYAQDLSSELSQYSGKRAAIVSFINGRLSWVKGFFADEASFGQSRLNFRGTVPDQELSTR